MFACCLIAHACVIISPLKYGRLKHGHSGRECWRETCIISLISVVHTVLLTVIAATYMHN